MLVSLSYNETRRLWATSTRPAHSQVHRKRLRADVPNLLGPQSRLSEQGRVGLGLRHGRYNGAEEPVHLRLLSGEDWCTFEQADQD